MGNERSKNIVLGILAVGLLAMTVAYAALSTNLNIGQNDTTVNVKGGTWNILFENGQIGESTGDRVTWVGSPSLTPTQIKGIKAIFGSSANGSISYDFRISNKGSIDANIINVIDINKTCKINGEEVTNANDIAICNGITATLKYKDNVKSSIGSTIYQVGGNGVDISQNDKLPAYSYVDAEFTINAVDNVANRLPSGDMTVEFSDIDIIYGQTTGTVIVPKLQYQVSYNTMGGSNVNSQTIDSGSAVGTLPETTKSRHQFLGWFTEEDGGTQITENTIPSGNTTYYARWEESEYEITFNSNGGSDVSPVIVNKGSSIGSLPTSEKEGYALNGWYTDLTGGTKITENTVPNGNITYYAHWDLAIICKRATTLHSETCNQSSNYCAADGYSYGSQITYGQLGTSGTLSNGDAFDCDVNADGTYDSATERFYYVSDYFDTSSKSFDSNYATLIYYSNTSSGVASTNNTSWHSSSYTSYGPGIAKNNLPTTSQWRNDLLKTTTRNILKGSGSSINETAKSGFSYSGYAARLLTAQELNRGCSITIRYSSTGELSSKCKYLLERTNYSSSSYSTYGPWLETAADSTYVWGVYSMNRNVEMRDTSSTNRHGARPVIDVPKSKITY